MVASSQAAQEQRMISNGSAAGTTAAKRSEQLLTLYWCKQVVATEPTFVIHHANAFEQVSLHSAWLLQQCIAAGHHKSTAVTTK